MCEISCLECPSFDGTCKMLKARIMKLSYAKILFRRFRNSIKNNIKKKLNIIKTYLYNLKIEALTVIYNIILETKTIVRTYLETRFLTY